MEVRVLVRLLSIVSVVLLLSSILFFNLLYIIALVLGILAILIYLRIKPVDMKPYYYLAVVATAGSALMFLYNGISGVVLYFTS